jgi:hypothetical protein
MTQPENSTTLYSIRVKDHLDLSWSDALGGVAITHQPDGTSRLHGRLPDQSALIAVMTRLNSLGVTVLSVEQTTGQ